LGSSHDPSERSERDLIGCRTSVCIGSTNEGRSSKPNAIGAILASLMLTCVLSVKPALADEPVCLTTERQPICTCELTQLRPLQGAVGMKQVIYMEKRIADHPQHERQKLEEDPIKVVAGVGGQLFIIDHHHTAEAWLRAVTEWGVKALCKVVNSEKGLPPEFKTEDEFWAALKAAGLVRLKNESGVDVDASQLPKTLEAIADDPYRGVSRGSFARRGASARAPGNLWNLFGLIGLDLNLRCWRMRTCRRTQTTRMRWWMKRFRWPTRRKLKIYQDIPR
jgi:hypothetical protein